MAPKSRLLGLVSKASEGLAPTQVSSLTSHQLPQMGFLSSP